MTITDAISAVEAEIDRAKSSVEESDRHNPGMKNSNSYYHGGKVAGLNFSLTLLKQLSAHYPT